MNYKRHWNDRRENPSPFFQLIATGMNPEAAHVNANLWNFYAIFLNLNVAKQGF